MLNEIELLMEAWLKFKAAEQLAVNERRRIEDRISELRGIRAEQDGAKYTESASGMKLTVDSRVNRRVDSDRLHELAIENGLEDCLQTLFRWKPELNLAAWRAADESITGPLSGAITTTQGRPSFKITFTEEA